MFNVFKMFREVRDKGNVIIVIGFMGSELWMVRSFFIIRMKGGYVVIILNDGDILRELFIYLYYNKRDW